MCRLEVARLQWRFLMTRHLSCWRRTHCLVRPYICGERKRSKILMTLSSNQSFRSQKSNGNITKFMRKRWF
uniref:Uncharacterized protein n=1 Tax=Populus trichocarpa TaxID=3694 RepID=A9PAB5_POPTR|nr:unknown [Populus trichocarpa]